MSDEPRRDYPDWVHPSLETVCARTGHPHGHPEPRDTVPGTDLCGPCHARFPRILRDLVDLYNPLTHAITSRRRAPRNTTVQTSGTTDLATLWNPAAEKAKAELNDWTRFLVRTLHRESPTVPALDETSRPDISLAAIAKWHARWLSRYPTLGPALLDDALRHRAAITRAIDSPHFVRIELPEHRTCHDIIDTTDYGPIRCRGRLVAVIRPDADEPPSAILCSANPGHTQIPPDEWIHVL